MAFHSWGRNSVLGEADRQSPGVGITVERTLTLIKDHIRTCINAHTHSFVDLDHIYKILEAVHLIKGKLS